VDNSLTPYIAAYVDDTVKVPRDYVKNNEIVLNVSMDATSNLKIENDAVRFKARFGGVAREIVVPMDHVIAIYARENGQGMAFPVPQSVLPRGDVQPTAQEEKRTALRAVPEAAPEEPTNILLMKSTPTVDDKPPEPPRPTPGAGKSATRPSLTRIK
jgi:stringent starvation protein B